MLHFTNGETEAQIKHLTKIPIASYMLELAFEPRCASTSYTRYFQRKGVSYINTFIFFSKSFQNMLPFVLQKPSLCFCCPETVEPEEGECQVRIHKKARFLQCQRALKCFHGGSWGRRKVEEVFQQHCCPPSLQGKKELPGQLTKRPLQLLQCKPSIFPTAILPSTSSSSLHHSMSWLPLPTGSGRMGK